ncbi:hypothetical protein GCM10010234_02670 [Streptomyces hawaiiensis]
MTTSRIWTREFLPVSGMLVTAAASPSRCAYGCAGATVYPGTDVRIRVKNDRPTNRRSYRTDAFG